MIWVGVNEILVFCHSVLSQNLWQAGWREACSVCMCMCVFICHQQRDF